MTVPGLPLTHLVLVEADLALRLREAFLNLPARGAYADQLRLNRPFWAERQKVRMLAWVLGITPHEQPATHPGGALFGEFQARPGTKCRCRAQPLSQLLGPFAPPL